MTQQRWKACWLMVLLAAVCLTGCMGGRTGETVHELRFPLDAVEELWISYDEEDVTVRQTDGTELVIRERMTGGGPRFGAKTEQRDGCIRIQEGSKPLLRGGFSRSVEVELPADYGGRLTITTTDGAIELAENDFRLVSLFVDSTAGQVRIAAAEAEQITVSSTRGALELGVLRAAELRLETTSGSIRCGLLEGHTVCTTTSGDVLIRSAKGAGEYRNDNDGTLCVTCTEVQGSLSFFNKNGDIRLTLPEELSFTFSGTTKNGAVRTFFSEGETAQAKSVSGQVGGAPSASIAAETKNGDIEVLRGEE